MFENNEDTRSLTLRTFSRQTIDALYRLKALTGKPVCRLADEIITDYFEKDAILWGQVREVENESGAELDKVICNLQAALLNLAVAEQSPTNELFGNPKNLIF